jgi:leucyl/phenylalanyl-tRNA--protein transferase
MPLGGGAGLRVSRSLRQRVRSGKFTLRCDTAFGAVIRSCAGPRAIEGQPELQTWINAEVIGLFEAFHRAGLAHSVEAWIDGEPGGPRLVGGLYGVSIGRVFCGESMFSRPEIGGRDASKVCLVHLVGHLRRGGFTLLDSQIANPHTESLGFVEWPAGKYVSTLRGSERGMWLAWDTGAALTEVVRWGS